MDPEIIKYIIKLPYVDVGSDHILYISKFYSKKLGEVYKCIVDLTSKNMNIRSPSNSPNNKKAFSNFIVSMIEESKPKTSESTELQIIETLPKEMITEILLRIDPDKILNFCNTSKYIKSICDNKTFRKEYRKIKGQNPTTSSFNDFMINLGFPYGFSELPKRGWYTRIVYSIDSKKGYKIEVFLDDSVYLYIRKGIESVSIEVYNSLNEIDFNIMLEDGSYEVEPTKYEIDGIVFIKHPTVKLFMKDVGIYEFIQNRKVKDVCNDLIGFSKYMFEQLKPLYS